jgi:protein TonB
MTEFSSFSSALGGVLLRAAIAMTALVAAGSSLAEPQTPAATAPPTDKEIIDNPVEMPPLKYPKAAYEARIEGIVSLEVTLAVDGTVTDAKVLKAEPPGWFEEAALAGVKRWRWRAPGRIMTFKLDVEFKLS